jgi:gliding motility-associated-like protein
MMTRFRNIGLLILLLFAGRMAAQVPVLDSVCSGAVRHYGVTGEAGSTYSWVLFPPAGPFVLLPSDADTLEMTWTYGAGTYELDVVQHSVDGCDADTVSGLIIIFEAPDVFAGPDGLVCVGRYYKLMDATAANTSSLLWQTSGDGTFDDITLLNATYTPGANDILAGGVTLTLTGFGLGFEDACEPSVSTIYLSIVTEIVPQFEPIGPLCQFSIPPALPDTSLEGITGNWTPPTISTDVLGIFNYTFSPDDPAQCGVDTIIQITITTEIIPQFEPIGPLCINSIPPALPDTSLEGITGTWEPPTIDTSVPGIFTYTFTPDDSTQCGVETTMDIAVVTEILPIFAPIGPLCEGSIAPALPDTSLNGIAGTWVPPVIDTSVPGTFTYTFTPYPDQCGLDTIIEITVLELVMPLFDTIGPLCQYSAAPVLPGTSLNGITGTWNPAWINTAVPGTFTYTFTPNDPDQCGLVTSMDITILPEITPEFDPIGPLCQYSAPPVLPDTSLNGISGTWDPPAISTDVTGTFFFTFTPDTIYLCTLPVTIAVTVVSEIIPQFDPIGPLCQNSIPPALPDTSLEGMTGTWVPPVIDTSVPGIFSFTFTPDPGQCGADTTIGIAIVTEITPQFDPIGPLCQNSVPPALPDTSLEGITGTWVPPAIDTSVPGTFTFTFNPDDPAQCGVDTTIQIIITTGIIPQFEPIGPLCQNSVPPALPDTSLEGITGTWVPPAIDTSVPGTFTFTFTPGDPAQCGVETTLTIEIVTEITPLFDPIGPLCHNSPAPALPDTSLEGITGTWVPPVIDTSVPGVFTYTFTPDDPAQCGVETTIDITVVTEIMPEFEPIGPLCQNSISPALPDTSLEGITGTWNPPVINTNVPGAFIYTFTPDDGQCALATTLEIEVIPEIIPVFDPIGPLSQNTTPPPLPGSSINVPPITGTWDPPFIDTSVPGTYTYTFTPDPGQCAVVTDMEITVLFNYLQAITGPGNHCMGKAAIVPIEVDKFVSVAEFQLKLNYNTDSLTCEGYINIHPQLAANLTGWYDQVTGEITLQWQDTSPLTFAGLEVVCDLVFTPKLPGQGQLHWYTGATESYFSDIDGLPIPAEFYAEKYTIYDPPVVILEDEKTVCEGDTVTIYGIASGLYPPIVYQWTYPDGSTHTTDPSFAGVTWTDAGDYTLLATDSLGCTDQKTIRLVVSANPVAAFSGTDTLTVAPDYILEAGPGMYLYLWNTGETTENISVDTTGWYWVDMKTHVGCTGTDSIYIIVSEDIVTECLYIPNAFTPNSDGLNDIFTAVSVCPLSYFRMMIFNRWGEELFESDDISIGWDGTKNGIPVPGDAYVYKIIYKAEDTIDASKELVKVGVVIKVE